MSPQQLQPGVNIPIGTFSFGAASVPSILEQEGQNIPRPSCSNVVATKKAQPKPKRILYNTFLGKVVARLWKKRVQMLTRRRKDMENSFDTWTRKQLVDFKAKISMNGK